MKLTRASFLIRSIIVLSWLCMMGWLVRYEAFPEIFTHEIGGYGGFLSRDTLVTDSWMQILVKNTPIGYTHSSMDINDANPVHYYELQNRVHMKINLMGTVQTVHAAATVFLDAIYNLQEFSFSFSAQGTSTVVSGVRGNGNIFDVTIKTPAYTDKRKVEIPDDVVLHSPQTEFAVKQLKPGQELSMRTLDPTTMKTTRIIIKALRTEEIEINRKQYVTTLLATEAWGRESLSWIDAEGTLVRQQTPFGWIFETCTPAAAYAAYKGSDGATEILGDMAVSCQGTIRDPRKQKRLVLELRGVPAAELQFPSSRHRAETLDETTVRLTVQSQPPPATVDPGALLSDRTRPYLAATSFIQSDHPDMIARAAEIVALQQTPMDKAQAIFHWVDKRVMNEMTASLPSALDVLKTMKGDCNEHTYLFVALARAAGLPAKVIVGLAHHQDAFYYHAWPSVFVGEWIEMDPTWGQEAVDATHIALAEGELDSQYQLLKVMGQLSITVIVQD